MRQVLSQYRYTFAFRKEPSKKSQVKSKKKQGIAGDPESSSGRNDAKSHQQNYDNQRFRKKVLPLRQRS
jgi:hypothetical protein